MHAAAAWGYLHIVQLLVNRRADPAATDAHGNTPLIEALQGGHLDIVTYLTSRGDELNKRQLFSPTKTGYTALALAVTECRMWPGTRDPGMDYSTLVGHIFADDLDHQLLPAASFPEDVASLPIPFQIFKTLVDAGSDLNSCSKSSGKPSVNRDRPHATSVHALVCVDIQCATDQ